MNPSAEPRDPVASTTEALDLAIVVIEGPADTTRRPRRPNIPLPGQEPRPAPPPPAGPA
jgi:hypothetical protein